MIFNIIKEILKKVIHFMILFSKMIIPIIIYDPLSMIYIPSWIRSLLPENNSLWDQVPWIPYKARKWLINYLKKNMNVFEYGSGGSTIFLSKSVKKLISIEHDKDWYSKVSCIISKEGITNCNYILSEPKENNNREKISKNIETNEINFKNYVTFIDKYPDVSFDLIFIDGMARKSCISHALRKVRLGGYIMFDNSDERRYFEGISLLNKYIRSDFFGLGPYCPFLWKTSIWKINS